MLLDCCSGPKKYKKHPYYSVENKDPRHQVARSHHAEPLSADIPMKRFNNVRKSSLIFGSQRHFD
ncbi:hypothetical protein BGZ76_002177, partial [Entomortierella beljakovae]